MSMDKEKMELEVISKFPLPALNFDESFGEELEGLQVTFDRIRIPSGGGLAFEVPTGNPDAPDMEKEISGIIVDHHPVNAYWMEKFDGQNVAPDCSSIDGKVGVGNPGGDCKTCPYNQFGSDGKGKACKNMHRLYILRGGDTFPVLITLPPTSIKPFADYVSKRVLLKGYHTYDVVTKITLKRMTNSTGIAYSQAQFQVAGLISEELKKDFRAYSESIKAVTRRTVVSDDEYTQSNIDMSKASEGDLPF